MEMNGKILSDESPQAPLSSALDGATSNHAFELHGSQALGSAIAANVPGPVNLNAIRSVT